MTTQTAINLLEIGQRGGDWRNAAEIPMPTDRAVWVRANIITEDEASASTEVEPFEGYAHYDHDWKLCKDARGMAITGFYGSEFIILEWMELAERAAIGAESEFSLSAEVDHLVCDWNPLITGYYARVTVRHTLTHVTVYETKLGPFSTSRGAFQTLGEPMLAASFAFTSEGTRRFSMEDCGRLPVSGTAEPEQDTTEPQEAPIEEHPNIGAIVDRFGVWETQTEAKSLINTIAETQRNFGALTEHDCRKVLNHLPHWAQVKWSRMKLATWLLACPPDVILGTVNETERSALLEVAA